ncbi:MAG: hypothetical protein H3C26_16020 [Rhodocyclaceae bacterium]|nr:hypothetical protein [Rhodocyclaceae bacterium]
MKMAKATAADLKAAMAVTAILEGLDRQWLPAGLAEKFGDDRFDIDNPEHLREVARLILVVASTGSIGRVAYGMLALLDPRNEMVDPAADTLEVHPRFERCEQERRRLRAALDEIAHSNRTKTGLKELAKEALFPAEVPA